MVRILACLAIVLCSSVARGETKEVTYAELIKIVKTAPYGVKIKAFIGVPVHQTDIDGIDYHIDEAKGVKDGVSVVIASALWLCENTREGPKMWAVVPEVRTNHAPVVVQQVPVVPLTIQPVCVGNV